MAVLLEVIPFTDAQDIAFHDLELFHHCDSGQLTKHRNPVTDRYTLRCPCGLEIVLVSAEAQKDIAYTAIDEQARTLSASAVQANLPGPVTVTARNKMS